MEPCLDNRAWMLYIYIYNIDDGFWGHEFPKSASLSKPVKSRLEVFVFVEFFHASSKGWEALKLPTSCHEVAKMAWSLPPLNGKLGCFGGCVFVGFLGSFFFLPTKKLDA